MRRALLVFLSLSLLAGTRCVAATTAASDPAATLRDAEYAFAATVADRDIARFRGFLDPQAIFASGKPLRGPEAIVEAWSYYFRPEAPPLVWCPTKAVVLNDGTMGMTTGPYETEIHDDSGQAVRARGTFFSVWRRQEDGSWKILFDSGTPPAPVAADTPKQLACASK